MKKFILALIACSVFASGAVYAIDETIVCPGRSLSVSLEDIPYYREGNVIPGIKITCATENKTIFLLSTGLSQNDVRLDSTAELILRAIHTGLQRMLSAERADRELNRNLAMLLSAKTNSWDVKLTYTNQTLISVENPLELKSLEVL